MRTVRYLPGIPRKPLPSGHVVVQNHVEPVGGRGRLGVDGFRAWIAAPDDDAGGEPIGERYDVERCDCGWASELPEHFRVRRAIDEA